MKQILGDNQFFGINHYDLGKGQSVQSKFDDIETIYTFLSESLDLGLDGFMINSNEKGYKLVNEFRYPSEKEIHYSVPYPHRFASMVNENGMLFLLKYFLSNGRLSSLFFSLPQFVITRNVKHILPIILDLEIPKNLPKGSYVYLQNVVTDLLIGIGREDLLIKYCEIVSVKGFKPGLITLNPILLSTKLTNLSSNIQHDLCLCYNINLSGFNVFPDRQQVEDFSLTKHPFKKMGMSILSSGGVGNIQESLVYIKKLNLDYVVYGSSKIENVASNFSIMKA